jgi:predicted dehydrogenase
MAVFYDPHADTARRLRDDFAPAATVETDLVAALEHPKLNGVIICSPTLAHYEQVCLVFERGLDVLCEKPLAGRRMEISDLIDRARQSGRLLSVAYQRRYKAPYATARRELSQRHDQYGPVQQIHVFVCERWQQTIAGTWRDDPAVGAGYFGDAGSHQIDVVSYITGLRPESVYAISDRRGSRVEIVTSVLARMTGGAGMTVHFVGDAQHWREDIHFHCREADLLLRNEQVFRCRENRIEPMTDLEPESNPDRGFLDALEKRQPTISPAECALPMFDWTAAVMQSVREERWVTV